MSGHLVCHLRSQASDVPLPGDRRPPDPLTFQARRVIRGTAVN